MDARALGARHADRAIAPSTPRRQSQPVGELTIQLMGRFDVCRDGQRVSIPGAGKRLVAFLSLHPGPQQRWHVAGQIWPEVNELRARANLRHAMWKTNATGPDIVVCVGEMISLASDVEVDVTTVRDAAERVIDISTEMGALPRPELFGNQLLQDWDTDWALFERERLKQLCVHALEALSARHLEARAYAAAIDTALLAVKLEPMRESAHRAVSRAHLAEGNVAEARRQYRQYRELLADELSIEPSAGYTELVCASHRATAHDN